MFLQFPRTFSVCIVTVKLDAYTAYGEYNTAGKIFVADKSQEVAVIVFGITRRLDSSQNCLRELGFQAFCAYMGCQQCGGKAIMLHRVGPRASVGSLMKQLQNQLPVLDGERIRCQFYGNSTFNDFDRSKVKHGYGEFI